MIFAIILLTFRNKNAIRLDLDEKGFDPRKLLKPGTQEIIDTITQKMELFGYSNKAK